MDIPPNIQTTVPTQPSEPLTPNFYRRHTRSLWFSLIGIAVVVAGLLAYILFFRRVEPPLQYVGDVKLAIKAPEESVSGSQVSYEISFENLSNTILKNLNLEVFYPDGFTFIDASADAIGSNFTFADLPKGQTQKLVVVGSLSGNVQEIKSVTAKLHYVPENFSSSFVASADAATIILPPEISIRVLAPTHLISGQSIKYEVEIANISQENFDGLALGLTYPSGFDFDSSSPLPSSGENSWKLPLLAVGATTHVIVEGRLTERAGEDVYITAELFSEKEGEKLSAGRSYAFTQVLAAPLKVTHQLRGGPGNVLASEDLEYEIKYENISDVGLANVVITMTFETPVFDLVEAKSDTGQIRGTQMVWQPGGVPELRIVNPGQKGTFFVRVPIKAENNLTIKNPVAQTRTEFRADTLTETLGGDFLAFKIGTNITLDASGSLASGPERPEIGQTSVYHVTLTVKNSVNDLENTELTAFIPRTDVTFQSATVSPTGEASRFQYLASSRKLVWRLGSVPAFSGKKVNARTIEFDLSITPEVSGFGSYPLLKDIEVQGLDTFTNELVLSEKIKSIDTR